MAKRRRKPQPVVMPKAESNRFTITIDPLKVAMGHQPHITGTGVHDNRPKRRRTRSAQTLAWKGEWN